MLIRIMLLIVSTMFLLSDSFAQERKNTLIYAEESFPLTLNPLYIDNTRDTAGFRLSKLLFNSLVCDDREDNMQTDLLDNIIPVSHSQDRKSYTFSLQKKVKWHDGEPFTAEDVEFTFRMIKDTRERASFKWIKGNVGTVTAITPYTVQFQLNSPVDTSEFLLEKVGYVNIIPKHCFPNDQGIIDRKNDFGITRVCGTGPYKCDSLDINAGEKIILSRNNDYFKGWKPLPQKTNRIDEIVMKYYSPMRETNVDKLQRREIDLLPDVPLGNEGKTWQMLEKSLSWDLTEYNTRCFFYLAFNCSKDNEFFNDRRVRRALTYAVDRKKIMNDIYGKDYVTAEDIMSGPYFLEQLNKPIRPLGYDDVYNYPQEENIATAKKLLEEAGFSPDSDGILKRKGKRFEVELVACLPREYVRICEKIQDSFRKIGVRMTIDTKTTNRDKWREKVVEKKEFDIAFGWENFYQYTDVVETLFSKDGEYNFVSYENSDVEGILKQLRKTTNPKDIRTYKSALQETIGNDCPYLFLFRIPMRSGYYQDLNIPIHPYWFFEFVNEWYRR